MPICEGCARWNDGQSIFSRWICPNSLPAKVCRLVEAIQVRIPRFWSSSEPSPGCGRYRILRTQIDFIHRCGTWRMERSEYSDAGMDTDLFIVTPNTLRGTAAIPDGHSTEAGNRPGNAARAKNLSCTHDPTMKMRSRGNLQKRSTPS